MLLRVSVRRGDRYGRPGASGFPLTTARMRHEGRRGLLLGVCHKESSPHAFTLRCKNDQHMCKMRKHECHTVGSHIWP